MRPEAAALPVVRRLGDGHRDPFILGPRRGSRVRVGDLLSNDARSVRSQNKTCTGRQQRCSANASMDASTLISVWSLTGASTHADHRRFIVKDVVFLAEPHEAARHDEPSGVVVALKIVAQP